MKKSDLKKIIAIGAVTAAAAVTTAIVISQYRKHKILREEEVKSLERKNAYITGGGISALASALYLVRDCGFTPSNVHVFVGQPPCHGNNKTGYICRRGKIISPKNSLNFFELMSSINSLDIPDLTVCDEILNIYNSGNNMRNITFIDNNKNVVNISQLRIEKAHRNAIVRLLRMKTEILRSVTVGEVLPSDFFTASFWNLMCAAYGFNKDTSAYEFANCLVHADDILSGTIPDGFDRYEEIIEPLKAHLKKTGVDICENSVVTDIDFENSKADSIHYTENNVRKVVYLNDGDICIFPTDEMTQCETFGSFNESAPKTYVQSYQLWEKLSKKNSAFKDPSIFFDDSESQMTQEFTITLSNHLLPELIDNVTCGALGNDGVIVLDNSNWKMTVCAVPQSHFKDMNEDMAVIWGCAPRFDRNGEKIAKPMTECSGAEILYELVSCFNLDEVWDEIRETVINVIPCHRKYDKAVTSPAVSKLEIIPTGIENFAVSGNFAESDNDTVFSEEYAVTTARSATYTLMKKGQRIFESKKTSLKGINKMLKNLR